MHTGDPHGEVNQDQHRFLGVAAAGAAAATALPLFGSARAARAAACRPQPQFGPVQQVQGRRAEHGYVEAGQAGDRPVILMHGFPYDIHSYVEVAPLWRPKGTG